MRKIKVVYITLSGDPNDAAQQVLDNLEGCIGILQDHNVAILNEEGCHTPQTNGRYPLKPDFIAISSTQAIISASIYLAFLIYPCHKEKPKNATLNISCEPRGQRGG